MRKFKTEKRIAKITKTVKSRRFSLRVVLENIHNPHNVSAIFRTCDAVGVPKITLLYNRETFPKISKTSSASSKKWVDYEKYSDVKECFKQLHKDGYKIYATAISKNAKNLYDLDLTKKVAIVMGNEHRGTSEEVMDFADEILFIPMRGMIQSLNVSVAAAVVLFEAQRQRAEKGMYNESELSESELEKIIDEWCEK